MPKNKYQKQIRQYSSDGGQTWHNVVPEQSRRGRLIEEASADCNPVEWREVTGSWFCVEFDEEYRWVDSGTYECHIGDKYTSLKEQVTYDGITWTDTGRTRDGDIVRNSADCTIDYDSEYLTIEVLSDTATVYTSVNGLEYRVDNGGWKIYNGGIEATLGQKIQWRGHMTSSRQTVFTTGSNAQIKVFGNINSVYDYDDFTDNCYDYYQFFYQNYNLIDAGNLVLPATAMRQLAYKCMFNDCARLVNAPALPATVLADNCYSQMFKGCTSLTTAPALPATVLATGCYHQMFGNCTALAAPPALPATTLASGCYYEMFAHCISMASAPALPATQMKQQCYSYMFQDCQSITSAPALNATSLAYACYEGMFWHCISLTGVQSELPATVLYSYCYHEMFKECTSLESAPVLPATTFANANGDNCMAWETESKPYAIYCYYSMFEKCTSLEYIKMMIAIVPDGYTLSNFTSDWVYQVASSGTFVKNGGATWDETGMNGVPQGWTVQYDGSATRWVDSGTYICQGNDKYSVEKEQVSTDGGHTWTDTGDTRTGSLIESSSQDCMYASEYLTITSLADNNRICWKNGNSSTSGTIRTIYISLDDGATWTSKASQRTDITIATLNTGDKMLVKGTTDKYYISAPNYFKSDGNVDLSGNIMSLLYGDEFASETELTANSTFRGIFSSLKVVDAGNLVLPATVLKDYCYEGMFNGRTTLTAAPALPAITLALECYCNMFKGCTSLVTAPVLPATVMKDYCYEGMFQDCTGLTAAPSLASTDLATGCYMSMFRGCTALTAAPVLPATTLAQNCYTNMFYNCTGIETAPELNATELVSGCYNYMFYGCTSLNYIRAMFTTSPSTTYTSNWVRNVASSGTFVMNNDAEWDVTGVNGIPSGWDIEYDFAD